MMNFAPSLRVWMRQHGARTTLAAGVALCCACHGAGRRSPVAPAPASRAESGRDSSGTRQAGTAVAAIALDSVPLALRLQPVTPADSARAAAVLRELPDTSPIELGPTWDIDVRSYETRERVAYWVTRFTGDARDRFQAQVERGTRYEPLMRARLRAAGLPGDLVYLALIESGYDPHAYSRAAAVGMWQFMTSTGRGAGLRVNWWIDERRDPLRSTEAAIGFLRYLLDQFGSTYLAAAAYNGGPGRVSRGLTRYETDLRGSTGDDIFFALAEKDYLRPETRDYVPRLIAAALVAKNPTHYGLVIHRLPTLAYDSARVPGGTPLAALARASHSPVDDVLDLNPQILRGLTAPGDSSWARIPAGAGPAFDSLFTALNRGERTGLSVWHSKSGESMARIARRHGLTAKQLAWYNPKAARLKNGDLHAGQVIRIPTAAVVTAARDVPDPAIERYGAGRAVHIVRRGETLGGIERRYHTSVTSLMRLNGLRKSTIFPGQALATRGSRAKTAKAKK
jgi:membrane-bound lytic murein transglycosylase D